MYNPLEDTAKQLSEEFEDCLILMQGVMLNNPWHNMQNLRAHCELTMRRMAFNLEFLFVRDEGKRERLAHHFLSNKGKSEYALSRYMLVVALLHDFGIIETGVADPKGQTTAPKHAEVGSYQVDYILRKKGYRESTTQFVCPLIKHHMAAHGAFKSQVKPEHVVSAIINFKLGFEKKALPLMLMGLSDTEASTLEASNPAEYNYRIDLYHQAIGDMDVPLTYKEKKADKEARKLQEG